MNAPTPTPCPTCADEIQTLRAALKTADQNMDATLAQLTAIAEERDTMRRDAERTVACVNACAGLDLLPAGGFLERQLWDTAVLEATRNQRDEAQAKLQKWLDVFGHLSVDPDEAGNILYGREH